MVVFLQQQMTAVTSYFWNDRLLLVLISNDNTVQYLITKWQLCNATKPLIIGFEILSMHVIQIFQHYFDFTNDHK